MEAREQRAIIIAATTKLDRKDGVWQVPSQADPKKKYAVRLDGDGSCTCPDCQEGGFVCKHLRAVRITLKRELGMDGTVTETASLTITEKRTYSQDWKRYNGAQCREKHRLEVLLHDLCAGLENFPPKPTGRKPRPVADSIFAMVLKVYVGFSARRFSCDLKDAHAAGYLSQPVPGMKVCAMLEDKRFTPMLEALVAKSAAPLAALEKNFAVDSSGFSGSRYDRWYDEKHGTPKRKVSWVKAHIACGVATNCITAARVLEQDSADCPQFKPLVKETAENFTVEEVSGDKAYASLENYKVVDRLGGTGFLAFKKNTTGGKGGIFERMFHYFAFKQEEFMQHYHQRSNVESTFSAVKRKFGDSVRSKTEAAMRNEVLCKFIAHNLTCLIQEETALGLDPVFWRSPVH